MENLQEPIIAWRAWRISDTWKPREPFGQLQSLYDDSIWPFGRPMEADFTKYSKASKSTPGLHALKTMQNLVDYLYEGMKYSHLINVPIVFGETYLWGKISEHENGYRAQFAYPKKIIVYKPYNSERSKPNFYYTKRIANNYGCEMFSLEGVINE